MNDDSILSGGDGRAHAKGVRGDAGFKWLMKVVKEEHDDTVKRAKQSESADAQLRYLNIASGISRAMRILEDDDIDKLGKT